MVAPGTPPGWRGGGSRSAPPAAEEAAAALTLRGLAGVGPARFRALIDRFGGARAALEGNHADFAEVAGRGAAGKRRSSGPTRGARHVVEQCAAAGIATLVYGSPGYPRSLGDLSAPPSVLFALGTTELLREPGVAIVGSRRATAYGRRVARQLGARVAAGGRCVVSGMAMGIDAAAHRGALPGPTAAVLGSGVDVVSPPRNERLYREIVEKGVVVSEYNPGVRAEPHHFPTRNRLIAALASDVVIVEASRKSGALITAGMALDLGREVHAVPGPIDRPTSEGTNRLIADGAGVIVDTGWTTPACTPQPRPRNPACANCSSSSRRRRSRWRRSRPPPDARLRRWRPP